MRKKRVDVGGRLMSKNFWALLKFLKIQMHERGVMLFIQEKGIR